MKKSTKKFGLLIVDDELGIRKKYKDALKEHLLLGPGWNSIADCEDGESALEYIKNYNEGYHLIVVTDAYMGPNCENNEIKDTSKLFGGVWLIDQVNKDDELKRFVTILLITFHDERIKSYRRGNDCFKWLENKDYYFVEKPRTGDTLQEQKFATEELSKGHPRETKKLFAKTYEAVEYIINRRGIITESRSAYREIVGESEIVKEISSKIESVASGDATVLITGDSGTGKELIAANIHYKSKRASCPLVIINCGAIPNELTESELFGYEKGAFTGAERKKIGLFEVADGGTIFLDEVGELSESQQVKLLRAIESMTFKRVGGVIDITVDVRIIAATNQRLASKIKEGTFREDLYYRLNVIPFHTKPLRERKDDIPLLVCNFLKALHTKSKIPEKKLDESGIILLKEYSWPGNIRQLQNIVERFFTASRKDIISKEEVAQALKEELDLSIQGVIFNDVLSFKDLEKEYAYYMLEKTKKGDGKWNYKEAAEMCGEGFQEDKLRGIIKKNKEDDPRFQNKETKI